MRTPKAAPLREAPRAQQLSLRTRRRLVVAGALALTLTMLLVLAALVGYEHQQTLARAAERNTLLARVFADQATRNVEAAALANATLASLLERGQAPDDSETRSALQQTLVNLPFVRGIAIVDGKGVVRGSADRSEIGLLIDLGALGPLPPPGREHLGQHVPGRRLADVARGAAAVATPAGVGFLPLLYTVARGDTRLHLVAQLNPEAFANFQQVTLADVGAAAALVSYDGRLIAGTASVQRVVGDTVGTLVPFTEFLPQREHGGWVGAGLRPGRQIGAFRVSATRPLVVLVEMAYDVALAEWWRRARGLLVAAGALLLLIGGMTFVVWRSVHARAAAQAERDLAQAVVARREQELRVTIQSLQELIFRTDVQGHITYANQAWAMAGGERPLWDMVVAGQRGAAKALFARASDKDVRRLLAAIGEAGGPLRTFDISVLPLHEQGRLTGFAGSAVDVTARVVAQRRLQAQLAFNAQLMDVSPMSQSVADLQGRYVLVNKAWEAFRGLSRRDVIGQRVRQHLPQDERDLHEAQDQALLRGGLPVRYEAKAWHQDGTQRDVVVDKLLLPGEAGQPSGILTVMVDVTEFRNAERATREARDLAEDASRSKSEFIANISHELRTPLQSIIGFSELGLRRGKEQPRLAAMFEDIHRAGHRMLALVNDLLDVAKIESTVGTIHLERSDLRHLVREVLRELEPLLARHQVRLVLSELPMRAKVDPKRFQQVVRNVLANAIKFSPPGSTLGVEGGYTDAGELLVAVSDEGPGIPPAELDSIFEAFVQSSHTKDGSGGTGLGLAISRKIIEALGGRITAENRPEGGAVFRIYLPARAAGETMPAPL